MPATTTAQQIATHLHHALHGGNWTAVALLPELQPLSWQQAAWQPPHTNSIGALVQHMHYYFIKQIAVLHADPLQASDAESWQYPAIASSEQWQQLLATLQQDAQTWITLVQALTEEQLHSPFAGTEKYGSWYRNLQGNIEHLHYHLGQIVLAKKALPGHLTETNVNVGATATGQG